jgi:hypothetical protein
MGWTSYYPTHFDSHLRINRKAECDAYFLEGMNKGYYNLIASRMVGSVYYAAVQPLRRAARDENGRVVKDEAGHIVAEDIPENELETFAVVFLTQVEKGMFYYKDMSETMGPCYYDCPKSILKKLSPTTNQYALEWRAKCLERAENLARANKMKTSLPALPVGSVIKFMYNGNEVWLQKCAPNYQFKTAWWKVDGDNKYFSKKRIPDAYEIVKFGGQK